jgi:hypothetical protein
VCECECECGAGGGGQGNCGLECGGGGGGGRQKGSECVSVSVSVLGAGRGVTHHVHQPQVRGTCARLLREPDVAQLAHPDTGVQEGGVLAQAQVAGVGLPGHQVLQSHRDAHTREAPPGAPRVALRAQGAGAGAACGGVGHGVSAGVVGHYASSTATATSTTAPLPLRSPGARAGWPHTRRRPRHANRGRRGRRGGGSGHPSTVVSCCRAVPRGGGRGTGPTGSGGPRGHRCVLVPGTLPCAASALLPCLLPRRHLVQGQGRHCWSQGVGRVGVGGGGGGHGGAWVGTPNGAGNGSRRVRGAIAGARSAGQGRGCERRGCAARQSPGCVQHGGGRRCHPSRKT